MTARDLATGEFMWTTPEGTVGFTSGAGGDGPRATPTLRRIEGDPVSKSASSGAKCTVCKNPGSSDIRCDLPLSLNRREARDDIGSSFSVGAKTTSIK